MIPVWPIVAVTIIVFVNLCYALVRYLVWRQLVRQRYRDGRVEATFLAILIFPVEWYDGRLANRWPDLADLDMGLRDAVHHEVSDRVPAELVAWYRAYYIVAMGTIGAGRMGVNGIEIVVVLHRMLWAWLLTFPRIRRATRPFRRRRSYRWYVR